MKPYREEVTGGRRNVHDELHCFYVPNVIRAKKNEGG